MEEDRFIDRVLREVAGAKDGIADSYLRLWREQQARGAAAGAPQREGEQTRAHEEEPDGQEPPAGGDDEPAPADDEGV